MDDTTSQQNKSKYEVTPSRRKQKGNRTKHDKKQNRKIVSLAGRSMAPRGSSAMPLERSILGRTLQGSSLRHIEVVIRAQVLDQMVLAGETIVALAGAVLNRAIAEDGVVHAGLVALEVCEAGEGLAAVVTAKGLCWSDGGGGDMLVGNAYKGMINV
jgi:hypothetical protein